MRIGLKIGCACFLTVIKFSDNFSTRYLTWLTNGDILALTLEKGYI